LRLNSTIPHKIKRVTPTTMRAMVFESFHEVWEKLKPSKMQTVPPTAQNRPKKSNSLI
jgi:hypothetical protein